MDITVDGMAKPTLGEDSSSLAWLQYFLWNRNNLLELDWEEPYRLTEAERAIILTSIQQFQLGESSEGHRLMQLGQHYAARTGDADFPLGLHLFIEEEQRHSATLGRFMDQQELPKLQADPVDGVFRLLRHMLSLELSVMAMVAAEIIAMPYYTALYRATQSPTLQQICRQLLRDEVRHLQFQADNLRKIRVGRSVAGRWLTHQIHRLLQAGALVVVWIQHRPVLEAGGYRFRSFWWSGWHWFNKMLDPSKSDA